MAGSAFQGMTLEVRREGEGLAVYTERGNKVGTLSRDSQGVVREGEQLYVCGALARDGNLRVAIG